MSTAQPKKRKLRPRQPITIAAAMVSQENCLAVLGINPQRYLARVVPLCKGYVITLGKLQLIPLHIVMDRLERLAESAAADDGTEDLAERLERLSDDEPTTPDQVLSRLGLRRSA